jgi:hypothetical protein
MSYSEDSGVRTHATIIGWLINDKKSYKAPKVVLSTGAVAVPHGMCVLYATGLVDDIANDRRMLNIDAWAHSMGEMNEDNPIPDHSGVGANPEEELELPEALKREPVSDYVAPTVELGPKKYKSRSFWVGEETEQVMIVPGGEKYPLPNRGWRKVTRVEMADIKREQNYEEIAYDDLGSAVDGHDDMMLELESGDGEFDDLL